MAPRILVVEDNRSLARTLARLLPEIGPVCVCAGIAEASAALSTFRPNIILLDFELCDGNAFDLLAIVAKSPPMPAVVVMSGVAGPEEAFRLGQLAVRVFLEKPVTLSDLKAAIMTALSLRPDVTPHVRASVGHVSVRQLESTVRDAMLDEALALSRGSRRGAARILRVSRQLVQHMMRGRAGRPRVRGVSEA